MKNILKYIFKDWRIADIVMLGLYLVIAPIFIAVPNLPILPLFTGLTLILSAIYLQKNTLLGYIVGLIGLGFLAYFLYLFNLLGGFLMILIFLVPLVIWQIIKLYIKKEDKKQSFEKWDYITLFGSILTMTYPTYLLLIQMESDYSFLQMLSFLIMFAVCYLQIKNIKWSKYLLAFTTILQLVPFVLHIVELELTIVTVAFALLLVLVYQIYLFATDMHKLRKNKSNE